MDKHYTNEQSRKMRKQVYVIDPVFNVERHHFLRDCCYWMWYHLIADNCRAPSSACLHTGILIEKLDSFSLFLLCEKFLFYFGRFQLWQDSFFSWITVIGLIEGLKKGFNCLGEFSSLSTLNPAIQHPQKKISLPENFRLSPHCKVQISFH